MRWLIAFLFTAALTLSAHAGTRAIWVNPLTNSTSGPGLIEITNKADLILRAKLDTWLMNVNKFHFRSITNGSVTWDDYADIVSVARSKGLEPWAWVPPYSVASDEIGLNPTWASVQRSGATNSGWTCLHRPEVRSYILAMLTTLANRYTNLAGIHLEEPGYETINYCICNYCTNWFWTNQSLDITANTTPVFNAMAARYSEVDSNFVAAARAVLNARGMQLTANVASYGESTSQRIGSYWSMWTTNALIDGFYPQLYSTNVASVSNDVAAVYAICPSVSLNPGIGVGWSGFSPSIQDPATVVAEINTVKAQGAAGFALFRLEFIDNTMADAIATTAPNTYYIDWATGSDANAGTAKSAPWKRCPGMNGFAGTYTHVAGDTFIFKGGTTWPNAAFQLRITAGGSSDSVRDFYTIDPAWFAGASFTAPAWDFENIPLGTGFNSAAGVLFDSSGGAFGYITLQGLDVKRHRGYISPPGADNGACTFTITSGVHDLTWSGCLIRDWSIPTPGAGEDGTGGGGIAMRAGAGSGCRVTACTLTQAGAINGIRSGRALSLYGTVEYSTIYDTPNGFLGSGTIHDCIIHDIVAATDPLAHPNSIYCFAPSSVYNNRVYNLAPSASAIYLSPSFSGGTGFDFCYNNLVYGTGAQAPIQVDLEGATPQLTGSHLYNNTLVASGGYCIRAVARGAATLGLLDMVNNHLVTDGGTAICYNNIGAGCANVLVVTNANNLIQTVAVANASGYSQANSYQPTTPTSPTVGTGSSLAPVFTTSLGGTTRVVPWDCGAYQFTGIIPPAPPTNVVLKAKHVNAGQIKHHP